MEVDSTFRNGLINALQGLSNFSKLKNLFQIALSSKKIYLQAYLLHMFGIITFFVTTQFPIVYDGIIQTLFRFTFLQILLTYAAGFYALIVIELPALNLENLFIQRPKIKLNKNGRGSRDSKDDKTKEQCSEFVSHKPRLISASTKSQDKE